MPGGVKSGFNHITINDPGEKKLYQVKGKKNVRVRQVMLSVHLKFLLVSHFLVSFFIVIILLYIFFYS